MQNKLNSIFWGTPDVASKTLEILKTSGFLPSLIITSPDKKQGRGMKLESSPVAKFAEENKILCLKPEKLDNSLVDKLREYKPDLNIVVAYGKIIPENMLKLPKLGSINVHYSLLPLYRGASPVESAILGGEQKTGVSIQKMIHRLDAGDVLVSQETNISPEEKAPELKNRLALIGGNLLVKILPDIVNGKISPVTQTEDKATYAKKIQKIDGLIDLDQDPVKNYNKFRAYFEWPRTFFFKNGKRFIITEAVLENEKFSIKKVLPEGKKEIPYKESSI